LKSFSAEKSKIADAAAICASVDMLPFSFVEGNGFKKLAKELIKIGKKFFSKLFKIKNHSQK